MKHFKYQTPGTFDEAEGLLKSKHPGEAAVMAGGTDLLGVLKDELLLEYPETIVALRDCASAIMRSHCACACAICCFIAASCPRYCSSFSTSTFIWDLSTELSL